ncbi:MAG: hypothetical protein ACKOZW_04705 [Cyanobium sp.]
MASLAGAATGVGTAAPGPAAPGDPAPPLQTFPARSAGLRGCFGLVRPREPGRPGGPADPLIAAWSLDGGWGVMRLQDRLQRFTITPARRWRDSRSPASDTVTPWWQLSWRVGRYSAELHFPSQRLTPRRWGGNGRLQLRSLATGDLYTLPVRVDGGC